VRADARTIPPNERVPVSLRWFGRFQSRSVVPLSPGDSRLRLRVDFATGSTPSARGTRRDRRQQPHSALTVRMFLPTAYTLTGGRTSTLKPSRRQGGAKFPFGCRKYWGAMCVRRARAGLPPAFGPTSGRLTRVLLFPSQRGTHGSPIGRGRRKSSRWIGLPVHR